MSRTSPQAIKNNRERREALGNELQFLGQMLSTETALFHHTVATKYGFTVTDMKTVSTIMQEGPMTAGQLAERLSLTTGAVTSVIDRLEKRGIVYRSADPNDRRKVIVKIDVQKMRHSLGTEYLSVGEAFKNLCKNYTTEQLEFLVDYYKISIELTKKEIAKAAKK